MSILKALLPSEANNDYRGGPVPLYVFCALSMLMLGRSLIHFFKGDSGVNSIATLVTFSGSPDPNQVVAAGDSLLLVAEPDGLARYELRGRLEALANRGHAGAVVRGERALVRTDRETAGRLVGLLGARGIRLRVLPRADAWRALPRSLLLLLGAPRHAHRGARERAVSPGRGRKGAPGLSGRVSLVAPATSCSSTPTW